MKIYVRIALGLITLSLAACGNKGPLVRPSAPHPKVALPSPITPPASSHQ